MKIHKKPILCSCWNDAYKYFTDISDKYFPNTKKIESEVKKLYSEHKGDPCWDEAYRRWLDSPNEEDDSEILYVIKDKHGNQLSSPNPDNSELWDRVSSLEARGRTGLSVVVYSNTKTDERSRAYRPIVSGTINRSFTCPSCHNKTLYCTEHDVAKIADVDHGDQFVCDECGSCFIAEPQFNGDLKFKSCFESSEYVKSAQNDRNQMTISVYSGMSSDGFDVHVKDAEGHSIFSKSYRYGSNASYDRNTAMQAHKDAEAAKKYGWKSGYYCEKPYVSDIIDDLCRTYHIDKKDIQVVAGRNVFKQTEVSDKKVSDFINSYIQSSTVTSSEDFENKIQEIAQEFTSENTSVNSGKLPAIFNMVHFEPGTINIDYGGGKFDNVAEYLTQYDVINLVYDPYNRSKEHNKEVLRTCKAAGGADTATCSNVLNVIKEPEVRKNVLENIKKIVKPTGIVYITVYEGSGKGNEGPTKSGYQLNRKTADYLQEIQEVFPDAVRKGKLIVAHPSGSSVTSATITAKLIDTPQDAIDELISVLDGYGFVLDLQFDPNPGRTWMGDVHLQVINTESHATTAEEVREYVSDAMIDDIHSVEDAHNCPITWNFGTNGSGQVTGGLDIMKKYVPDDKGSDIYSSDNGLQSRIYDYLDTLGGYEDYNQKIEEVVDEFGVSPDVAETYVCNWIQNSRAEWSDEADIEDDEIYGAYRSTGAPREEDLPSGYWNPGVEDKEELDRRSLEESNRQEQDQLESLCYDAVSKCGGDLDDFRCHIVHNDGYDTVKIHFMSCVEGVLPRKFEDKAIKNLEDAFAGTRFNSNIRVHTASPRRWEIKDNFTNYLIDVYADAFDEELPFQASTDVSSTTVTSRKLDSVRKELTDKLYNAASKLLQTPEYGFPFDEIANMLFVDINKDSIGLRVEVRAELSYDGMWGLKEKLDPIVQKYDKDAYFDMDDPGIMSAYLTIANDTIESANYGGAYDIDPHSYFTKDDIMEFAYDVADEFSTWAEGTYDVEDTYLENNRLYLSLWNNDEQVSYFAECTVDMRRIQRPSDLNKYKDCMLKKLKDAYNEYHVSDDEIISSTYDYPERPIDPPEYDEPSYETDECTIELDLDTVITVDSDGSWEYEDEEYSFATNPDSKDGDWYSDEDEVHVIDPVGVVEQLDEFIEDRIPALPGRYRIKGKVTLVYDVEGIAVDYTYDSYDEDSYRDVVDKDNAEVTWNESKSSIDHIDITEE